LSDTDQLTDQLTAENAALKNEIVALQSELKASREANADKLERMADADGEIDRLGAKLDKILKIARDDAVEPFDDDEEELDMKRNKMGIIKRFKKYLVRKLPHIPSKHKLYNQLFMKTFTIYDIADLYTITLTDKNGKAIWTNKRDDT
jgi:hypothetical protein